MIWLVAVALSMAAAFLGVQFQESASDAEANSKAIVKLEDQTEEGLFRQENTFEQEIARLDESNTTRRNDLAALEERIAVLETASGGKASDGQLASVSERVARLEAVEGAPK